MTAVAPGSSSNAGSRRRRSARWVTALVLASALAVAAWAASVSSSSAANLPSVRIMISGGDCCETPQQFMWPTIFKQRNVGLNVDWAPITSGGSAVLGLALSGQEDVVQVSDVATIAAVAAGQPARMFASVEQGIWVGFAVTKDVAASLATRGITPKSPLKKRIQALTGLRMWANNPGSRDILYNKMFKDNGVDPQDIKYQYGSDQAGEAAWRSGDIDVYNCCDPQVFADRPDAVEWIKPGEAPELLVDYHLDWVTTLKYGTEHPDVIKRIIKGLNQTNALIAQAKPGYKARGQVVNMIHNQDSALPTSFIARSVAANWKHQLLYGSPVIKRSVLQATIDDYNAGQPAEKRVSVKPQDLVLPGYLSQK